MDHFVRLKIFVFAFLPHLLQFCADSILKIAEAIEQFVVSSRKLLQIGLIRLHNGCGFDPRHFLELLILINRTLLLVSYEIDHLFKLGTHYLQSFQTVFLDRKQSTSF